MAMFKENTNAEVEIIKARKSIDDKEKTDDLINVLENQLDALY